ncbi:hypothetical protein JCM17844_12520 [Iodidimonas gelatinilytica]|uniref:Uncharacterized protein n=1 Tax=Iodidimonas gelatinilytica TaxID=1236966 RepID=A0A5A7MRJ1_9PROT|nr:hypothetical protein JCM17844_12520 [Iodidimonas gelatinilytica]
MIARRITGFGFSHGFSGINQGPAFGQIAAVDQSLHRNRYKSRIGRKYIPVRISKLAGFRIKMDGICGPRGK